jgi:hypothetical protein
MVSGLVVIGLTVCVPMPLEITTAVDEDPAQRTGPGRLVAMAPATVALVALLAWSVFWDLLWLAVPSALWLGLAILDDLGGLRLAHEGRSKQTTWPYLPRVAVLASTVGAALGLLLVAVR